VGSRSRHRPRPAPASESGSAQVRRRSDLPRVGVQWPGTAQPRNVAGPGPLSLRKHRSCAREGAPTARVRARAPAAARPQEAVRPLAAAAAPMPGPVAVRRTAPRWQTRPASPAASGPPPARAWPAPRAARGASPPPPPAGRGTHRHRCRRCPSPSPSRCRWGSRSPPAAPGGRFSTLRRGGRAVSAGDSCRAETRPRGALFDFFLPEYSLISTVSAVQVTLGPAARGAAPRSRSTGSAGSGSVVTTAPSAAAAICIVVEPAPSDRLDSGNHSRETADTPAPLCGQAKLVCPWRARSRELNRWPAGCCACVIRRAQRFS